MKKFFALLVLGILLIGSTYGQPDLSDRIQPLPVEYDVGCQYDPVSFCNNFCEPRMVTNDVPSEAGGDEFPIVAYGLARSCGWTVYTFLTLSNPFLPCDYPDEYDGLCERTQTTNSLIFNYSHTYGLAYSS